MTPAKEPDVAEPVYADPCPWCGGDHKSKGKKVPKNADARKVKRLNPCCKNPDWVTCDREAPSSQSWDEYCRSCGAWYGVPEW